MAAKTINKTGFLYPIESISLRFKVVCVLIFLLPISVLAQNDTLKLKNNDIIVGEIKNLEDGVLTIETSYSDEDFKIEFNKVSELIIQRKSLIILTDGSRRFGNIRTEGPGKAVLSLDDGTVEKFALTEIIALEEVDDNFWKRFRGSIDIGYNLSKANNNTQFSVGGKLDYTGETLLIEGSINSLNSRQDDAEETDRTDANIEFLRLLPRDWYLLGEVSFLSNTEQALDARISTSLGIGKLIISTNKLYFLADVGLTYNIENYVDTSFNKTSSEAYIGLSFKMFDYEDIDLDTSVKFYPGLSEKGRFRTDYDLTLKYDLPHDFYIKMGFTLNYDNQPAIPGSDFDYVFTSGIGWEFNK